MATAQNVTWLTKEIADLLASCPSREELLNFRPSDQVQQRASELLQKLKDGRITREEQWELDQFGFAESLMRLIKARLRTPKTQ
jgi:hypothetical protein